MASVFLSYSRSDRETAQRIAEGLSARGFDVFWGDDREIAAGDSWEEVIADALKTAAAVVVLWSPTSVKRAHVRSEALAAIEAGKYVPVTLRSLAVEKLPVFARHRNTLDMTEWDGAHDAEAFEVLARAVGFLRQRAEPPAPDRAPSAPRGGAAGGVGGFGGIFRRRAKKAAPQEAPASPPPAPAPAEADATITRAGAGPTIGAEPATPADRPYTPIPNAGDIRIFIAHGSNDKPRIKPILRTFLQQGFQIWIDNPAFLECSLEEEARISRIKVGGDWQVNIADAVRETDVVCGFWSHDVLDARRERVFYEIYQGLSGQKLFQALLDKDLDIGYPWLFEHFVSLTEYQEGSYLYELDYLMQDIAAGR